MQMCYIDNFDLQFFCWNIVKASSKRNSQKTYNAFSDILLLSSSPS